MIDKPDDDARVPFENTRAAMTARIASTMRDIEAGDWNAYEMVDIDNVRLVIGCPPSRTRPALFMWTRRPNGDEQLSVLAQFHDVQAAAVVVEFLDVFADQVGRVVNHQLAQLNNSNNPTPETPG